LEKVLIVSTDKCTGCKICELACSMAKLGEFNPDKSYIKVLRNKDMDINLVTMSTRCDFCGECIESCPPVALQFVDFNEAILKWKGVKVVSLPAPLVSNL
jgi:anaerobic carbon-monoxide dehydrogenase iron sulfur subunit